MAGVKSLLGAAARDMEQTTKAQAKPSEAKTKEDKSNSTKKSDKPAVKTVESPKMEKVEDISTFVEPNKGGRPELSDDEKRHQYTLTLTRATRQKYMDFLKTKTAKNLRIKSFSDLAEAAMDEFINNNSN